MEIKVFEAFCGYGSQAMALERIKNDIVDFNYEVVGVSDIDKNALNAYAAIHGHCPNFGDISSIDWQQVPDFDLFTYSFPCGLEGTLVLTQDGYKDISKVVVGDKVMTHNNRYRDVIRTMSRICDSHYKINGTGCELYLTAEHPLYVLRDDVEQWVKVKDLKKSDRISYCIPNSNNRSLLSNQQLWLLGRYVADGFVNKHLYNSVEFAIGMHKEEYFLEHIPVELKDKFKRFKKSCYEYRVADKDLQELCLQFGNGSKNKRIPQWVIDLPNEQIDHFLDGYFSGDGHVRYKGDTKEQMFSTVSKELFLGIQLLLLKRYGKVCSLSIRHDKRKETFNDTYNGQMVFSQKSKQTTIGFRVYVPINSIEYIDGDVQVYNLEVEEDNSYTCDNVNTHNCTDISNAGKQAGLSEGSGTRSGLLWECRKPIEVKRPKYLLMENVKSLVGKKYIEEFQKWINILESYGYKNYYKVLDAANYNMPQHRERVFMVSILDGEYEFPEKLPLEKQVVDILDKEVDESYYLKENKLPDSTYGIINDTFTGECPVIYGWSRNNDGTIKNWHPVNIANCVTASKRDNTQNYIKEVDGRVRKLTTNECFRLMGLSDTDIEKLNNSNIGKTALSKMAGNSIVVDVLYHVMKNMFKN
jgi:DNA (cytosine-5)-methyltransferase 1